MDAVRISDQAIVVLKRVLKSDHEFEVDIATYLSSDDLRQDPRNHCAPVIELLEVPEDSDSTVIVMPLLRGCNDPHWSTVGEVVSFLIQIFEACVFSLSTCSSLTFHSARGRAEGQLQASWLLRQVLGASEGHVDHQRRAY